MSDAREPEVDILLSRAVVSLRFSVKIVSTSVKKLNNTNFIASRHIKREISSLPLVVRLSKTPSLKLPIAQEVSVKRGN